MPYAGVFIYIYMYIDKGSYCDLYIHEISIKIDVGIDLLQYDVLRSNAADNHVPVEYALCQMQKPIKIRATLCGLVMWLKWFIAHPNVICSAAMLRVSMSLESNPSTLFTYFIYIGMDAIIKT